MAIVVTWDDWGGFYDSVAPPVKKCANGQIFQEGFRVPAIIVSPYAKKGFVLKTPAEQASHRRPAPTGPAERRSYATLPAIRKAKELDAYL
jgi:phospholipase C